MTPEKAIRQLREDVLNARECEDDTAEVPVDAIEAALAEIDRLRKSQAPTHIHFRFDDIELATPIGSGADHVIFDGNPCAETYRFNPKGIVVNQSRLKTVRLLNPAQMNAMDIPADTLLNRRTARKDPADA